MGDSETTLLDALAEARRRAVPLSTVIREAGLVRDSRECRVPS